MSISERVGPERLWALAVGAVVAALTLGSVLFPETVYEGFLWQYFWGPVQADAHSASCAARTAGGVEYLDSAAACLAHDGRVAYPGYTLVSEAGYATTLVIALIGVAFLLNRLELTRYRELFYGLVPFMFFGGALRVVEDANDRAAEAGVQPAIDYPLNTLFISPIIYFTVFVLAVVTLVVALRLERTGRVRNYEYPLAGIGLALSAGAVSYLAALAVTTDYVEFHGTILVVTVVGILAATAITWGAVNRFAPGINAGTEHIGLVLILGHAIDGVANVVGLDWAAELGLGSDLYPKHPVNEAVVRLTDTLLPAGVTDVIGTAWPFLLLKMVVVVLVIWVFNDEAFEESPRYTIMMLIAILAVGMGPGTRDMLRATFGV